MTFIFIRLLNLGWYWLIGYRFNDADGAAKLFYAGRWVWARLRCNRRAGVAVPRPLPPLHSDRSASC